MSLRGLRHVLLGLLTVIVLALAAVFYWQWSNEPGSGISSPPVADRQAQLRRGEYLARAGNCVSCHTARGGATLAGGRQMPTPFGTIVTPNITPDRDTGIGQWSADDFWRAMHNGRGRKGEFLYPAFPYPNYTRVTRADSDAIHAWLASLPAVRQQNAPHQLRFPYDQRWLLGYWRALYFRPGVWQEDTRLDAQWNRGAYLVQGLGHCNACHASRNFLGATSLTGELTGGLIPMLNWYAPALGGNAEGLERWDVASLTRFMKTGVSEHGAAYGPMAEVVRQSLQHLSEDDLRAMAIYMKSLPAVAPAPAPTHLKPAVADGLVKQGGPIYEKHCIDCHGKDGRGQGRDIPPLQGNQSVTTPVANNAIRMVLHGGFAPATAGNPRPMGMPPYGPFLSDEEVAAVVSYIRAAWGNRGGAVSADEVARLRSVPID